MFQDSGTAECRFHHLGGLIGCQSGHQGGSILHLGWVPRIADTVRPLSVPCVCSHFVPHTCTLHPCTPCTWASCTPCTPQVSIEPLSDLSSKEGSRLGEKMDYARRVGLDLVRFMQSYPTQVVNGGARVAVGGCMEEEAWRWEHTWLLLRFTVAGDVMSV